MGGAYPLYRFVKERIILSGNKVSIAVIRRLPRYYRYLEDLLANGVTRISSGSLAQKMGLTASQIRQDLNCFGGFGQQGYGYNVENLKNAIAEILGVEEQYRAIIIGVGNMGRALINNFKFERRGFKLVCGFDADKQIAGKVMAGVPILHVDELEEYCLTEKPDIAVLTLPGELAPEMAKRLSAVGIKGMWNFTSHDLHLINPEIEVENVHFSDSLMTLCYKITERKRNA